MANYKISIIAGLAAATTAGLIAATAPAQRHYNNFHLDDHIRTEEINYRVNDACATANDLYRTAKTRLENGVLAARYGNSSNFGDITLAGTVIGGILGGLVLLGRKLKNKGEA